MIFCKIDSVLLDIIKSEANGRTIIDCGAGDGLLGSLTDKVIGLDIFPPEKPLSKIIMADCETFKFPSRCLPVFIRPCHSGFPAKTIENNIDKFETVLYVSEEKNIDSDLGYIAEDFKIERIGDWVGEDGEFCYRITINEKKPENMKTFVLVKSYLGAKGQCERIGWFELGELDERNKLHKIYHGNGFSYCYIGKDDEILETIEAENWDAVETPENKAKNTWYQNLVKDATDKSLKIGWLAPDGKMHYCRYENHITYVHEILESDVPTIEELGWIHVYAGADTIMPNSGKRMTQEQARTAREELGLNVFDDDIQYQ